MCVCVVHPLYYKLDAHSNITTLNCMCVCVVCAVNRVVFSCVSVLQNLSSTSSSSIERLCVCVCVCVNAVCVCMCLPVVRNCVCVLCRV